VSSADRPIHRVLAGGVARADRDRLAVEAPLELRVGGAPVMVTMRTPGHDLELIAGLLISEGVIGPDEIDRVAALDVDSLSADERGNVVALAMDAEAFADKWPGRSLYASSACGVCGKTAIADLASRAAPLRSALAVPAEVIAAIPDRLRQRQPVFDATGGLHAAGLFTASGELLAAREDVGRHNAVDKLIGWAARAGEIPAAERILAVTGRISFELAHKAVALGAPILVAVSAPSSLAVDVAERFRLTLCGFVRGGGFNVYSHPRRVEPAAEKEDAGGGAPGV
jgi:FdhD protein